MRDILFRGKRKDNGEWVYGDLLSPLKGEPAGIVDGGWVVPVVPDTVGEYIGLEDRNGKKIFEGDIVAHERWNGGYNYAPVHYGEFNCSCCDGVYGWSFYPEDIRNPEFYVVGGNIHDNPELLKEET